MPGFLLAFVEKTEKHDGFNITEEEGRNLLKYFTNSL
jgi:hypothetical protein